jgi:hypothetical protein
MLCSDKLGRCWLKKCDYGYEIIFVRRGHAFRQVMGRALGPDALNRARAALLEVVAQNNRADLVAHQGVV